jgi:hypothetical protein
MLSLHPATDRFLSKIDIKTERKFSQKKVSKSFGKKKKISTFAPAKTTKVV